MLSDAAEYASTANMQRASSRMGKMLMGFAFMGGCALTSITFIPLLWGRKWIAAGVGLAALAGIIVALGWVDVPAVSPAGSQQWNWVSGQLAFYILGGIATLVLAIEDWWPRRDPDSALLALWVLGTFFFAAFVNWTINARSVLPLIPALGILIARRVDSMST